MLLLIQEVILLVLLEFRRQSMLLVLSEVLRHTAFLYKSDAEPSLLSSSSTSLFCKLATTGLILQCPCLGAGPRVHMSSRRSLC